MCIYVKVVRYGLRCVFRKYAIACVCHIICALRFLCVQDKNNKRYAPCMYVCIYMRVHHCCGSLDACTRAGPAPPRCCLMAA